MKSLRALATGVSFLCVGGVLALAGISKLLERDEFKSAASVLVPEPSSTNQGLYFPLTEFERLQSPLILSNVAASLDLNERWGEKYNRGQALSDSETEERIKRHLELRNVPNTRFIQIITYDDDPKEAANLANAIAQKYSEFRRDESQRRAAELDERRVITDPMVIVIDRAIPEFKPVRPNRYLAGALLGCGMFLMMVGIVGLGARQG